MRFFCSLLALPLLVLSGTVSAADKPNYKEVTFAAGASESSVFDISTITPGSGSLLGLFMPTAWTTANITFMVSPTCGAPWYNAYDDTGAEYTVAAVEETTDIDGNTVPAQPACGDPNKWYCCIRSNEIVTEPEGIEAVDPSVGASVCGVWA